MPIAIEAPADRKTRDKWLDRLWQAIEDDGVDYLSLVQDRWAIFAVPVKLLLAGRTDSSACFGRLGPIHGQETMFAEPAPVSPACWQRAAIRNCLSYCRFGGTRSGMTANSGCRRCCPKVAWMMHWPMRKLREA